MTNPNEIVDGYKRYREALAAANRMNKDALFDALESAGITALNVDFDGEGDSGQIGDVTAHSGDAVIPLPELKITLHRASDHAGKVDSKESDLTEAVVALCFDFLEQNQEGWENNDGAYGEFTFDVAMRKIDLDFSARVSGIVSFHHSF